MNIKKLDGKALFFWEEIGSGEYEGEKFTVGMSTTNHSIFIIIRGQRYVAEIREIVNELLDFSDTASTPESG